MNKDQIISEIQRTAEQNGGIPLGIDRFCEQTGIQKKDWYGIHWAKWADAQVEAGYTPNQFSTPAFEENLIIEKVIALIRELGHFPTKPEFMLKRNRDNEFPAVTTLRNRLGKKLEMIRKISNYCDSKIGYSDVSDICNTILSSHQHKFSTESYSDIPNTTVGHVYLLRHNKAFKIGKSIDVTRRYREIKVQMPYVIEEVHVIETDDPSGIEAYWHNRFKDKRLEGEWFELCADDVKAFKRRKFM